MKIFESEILDALRAAMQKSAGGDGFTIREIREATGWSGGKATEALRVLLINRTAEAVRVYRTAMDGSTRNVSGYRLVTQKKKKK